MKKAITSMATVVILAVGVPAAAMNCHRAGHGSSGPDKSHKVEDHKVSEKKTGAAQNEMNAGKEHSEEDLMSGEEAKNAVLSFMENNMHGFKVGETFIDEENVSGIPVYGAEVTLADGSTGILFIDALNGEPMGIMMGEYADLMRKTGRTASTMGDSSAKKDAGHGTAGDLSAHSH